MKRSTTDVLDAIDQALNDDPVRAIRADLTLDRVFPGGDVEPCEKCGWSRMLSHSYVRCGAHDRTPHARGCRFSPCPASRAVLLHLSDIDIESRLAVEATVWLATEGFALGQVVTSHSWVEESDGGEDTPSIEVGP